jgi:hypothetical protein
MMSGLAKLAIHRLGNWAVVLCLILGQAMPIAAAIDRIDRACEMACCARGKKAHACCQRTRGAAGTATLRAHGCTCATHWNAPSPLGATLSGQALGLKQEILFLFSPVPLTVDLPWRQAAALDSRPPPRV